jgi:hypothetical protein
MELHCAPTLSNRRRLSQERPRSHRLLRRQRLEVTAAVADLHMIPDVANRFIERAHLS